MEQPAPIKNEHPAMWDVVVSEIDKLVFANPFQRDSLSKLLIDIKERDAFGLLKYGTRLRPFNGREFLIDAYQESMDLTVYLRGKLYEASEQMIVTDEQTILINALGPLYMQSVETTLRLRFLIGVINKEIQIQQNDKIIIEPGNGRNS